MANVLFKRGTQAELNALITASKIKDGAFYLTTDTNRLYVGNGSTFLEIDTGKVFIFDKENSIWREI